MRRPGAARLLLVVAALAVNSSAAGAGADAFPMGSSPNDVSARFPPFQCHTVSLGGQRSFCRYFEPPPTHMQFNVPDLNFLWGFPVHGTSFTFNDGGLQEINWTLEARGKPGGKVIDPAKLHAALESRFGKPASAREIAYGRDGVLKRLDTTWLVNGERWLYSTYPRGGGNVDLRRLSKDAPAEP